MSYHKKGQIWSRASNKIHSGEDSDRGFQDMNERVKLG